MCTPTSLPVCINAYSLFLYAFRSPITKDCYLMRMKIFLKYINILPNGNLKEQYHLFATKGLEDHKWAFNNINNFLQYQKERAEALSFGRSFLLKIQ